jgi:hypothetical protein
MSSTVPVLVTPMNIIRAQEFDSFAKVHLDFMLIIIAIIFIIYGVSKIESGLPERKPLNLPRPKEARRGTP